ncbi:MAG: hemolysin family protein [Roseiflexaceae bacterium]
MLDTLMRLGGVAVLVLLNGFFVAAEFALVGARRTRLDQLAAAGNSAAALSRRMQENLDRYVAAAQLGITLASLALGWIGESTIASLIDPPIEALLGQLLEPVVAETAALTLSHAVAVAISFFIITTLHIVLGEQAPKVFAIRSPEQAALFIATPLAAFNWLFAPVIRFLDWATGVVLRLFGVGEAAGHTKVHSAEELRLLVEESGEAGVLNEEAQEMLMNVFSFADRPAYQAMLPRTEVVTIDHDATVREFLDRFAETGHTRFPVLGPGGIDDVRGIVSAKDLLVALRNGDLSLEGSIASLVRPAFFTPETKHIGDLLRELRHQHIRMAILVDEYGGMAGVVTMEDLVEEIVGELDDELEHDEQEMRTIDEHTSVVEGQIRLEDLNEELRLNLPSGDYETLAGFLLQRLGRLPAPSDSLVYNNVRFVVLSMHGPRIKEVEITKL